LAQELSLLCEGYFRYESDLRGVVTVGSPGECTAQVAR